MFLVDAETYLPLTHRYTVRLRSRVLFESNSRFTVYERLPLDARGRELLLLDRHPGARYVDRSGRTLPRSARREP